MSQAMYAGEQLLKFSDTLVEGNYVSLFGETYYAIKNVDQMPPFFMTIVSASNHWLFVSSTGGLSAGRVNADSALFPYYTDDKISENAENTGPKTILQVTKGGKTFLWEPFSERYKGLYACERTLYKHICGNKLIFEETNLDLGLRYRYAWQTSDRYGFVKTSHLESLSSEGCHITLLDGLQNILPYGASTQLQTQLSNLLDAYKKNELEHRTGLGLFTLSSTLTDLAEPSESLKASTVWQVGLENPLYLLSNRQLENFRRGEPLRPEEEVRGQRGAYFVHSAFHLGGGVTQTWSLISDVEIDHARLTALIQELKEDRASLWAKVTRDIQAGSTQLQTLVAQADGLQLSGDYLASTHHFANVLFNVMRGGIFSSQHTLHKSDLLDFIRQRSPKLAIHHTDFFAQLPETMLYTELVAYAANALSPNLERLCREYLPLSFSRRHGDPSRPWNHFSINLKNPDGSQRLDYQGNWRDIFQNWEPLVCAFPAYSEAVICAFLNATTADGYNPYRLTRAGFEWEKPEPENPWANIGYWGDHQIIYLQKLLELSHELHPGVLAELLNRPIFSYANVPYRIKPYRAMLEDAYNTIDFDTALDKDIETNLPGLGSDAKLLRNSLGDVLHVGMLEKVLTLVLAKLSNLVPEGGIWMNTQRPEWNDANNALVGKGLSVVTTAYLRRMVVFLQTLVDESDLTYFEIQPEVKVFFEGVWQTLENHQATLSLNFSDTERRTFMNTLGELASSYRESLYQHGFSGEVTTLAKGHLKSFLELARRYLEHTLRANRRPDQLFHGYNLLVLGDVDTRVEHLDEMLEGQVAMLSSGMLSSREALLLLDNLRHSRLYREDNHSYTLYPDKRLTPFLEKNQLSETQVKDMKLVAALVANKDTSLIVCDEAGNYHFNGSFKNMKSVRQALADLAKQPVYADLVRREASKLCQLFEEVFDHASFTGRSGTFFAYEGLGSIYWHMVSKLLLAVQECYLQAYKANEPAEVLEALKAHYYDIRAGLGFNKSPARYGAFPTDPYSHTPAQQGAKQPGMTGQVKEEILTRSKELGLFLEAGQLRFDLGLMQDREWLEEPTTFTYIDIDKQEQTLQLPADSLVYTVCQVPVVYLRSDKAEIILNYTDGHEHHINGHRLDTNYSHAIFSRSGQIRKLVVHFPVSKSMPAMT
jgi:hypothetical protein